MDEKNVLAGIDMSDSLEHYGRMHMKWYQHIFGDEDPRAKYSKKGGLSKNKKAVPSGTPAKAAEKIKKAQKAEEKKKIKEVRKQVKAEKAEQKEKEKIRISQEEYNRKKKEILESENSKLVYENRKHFTTQELTDFNNRMSQISRLQTTINGQKKTAKLLSASKTYNEYTTAFTSTYANTVKMIGIIESQLNKKKG